jgi:hypothetical protein
MFLTTGRCGTQWLTATLAELYPHVHVEHEPIGPLYAPRRHFRRWEGSERILEEPAVAEHLKGILSEQTDYIETGWPLFPTLPYLAREAPERLRVVHLTRHPVPTSLSHLAHSSFAGSERDDSFTRLATLAPTDERVFQPEYEAGWTTLTPYEKCLYWWTEVNLFGLEFAERAAHIPLLRVAAEPLLAGVPEVRDGLLSFLGLPDHPGWAAATKRVVDRWQHHTDQPVEPRLVARHQRAVLTAAILGYDALSFDLQALRGRYAGTPDRGADRFGRYGTPGQDGSPGLDGSRLLDQEEQQITPATRPKLA